VKFTLVLLQELGLSFSDEDDGTAYGAHVHGNIIKVQDQDRRTDQNANVHRHTLQEYNLTLLDHAISIVTASTLLAYALYTFSAPNLPQNHAMMLTIPFILYFMFRYMYLIHVKGDGGAPEMLLYTDWPLLLDTVLWGVSVILVMYVFND